jgi:hypothetical protein
LFSAKKPLEGSYEKVNRAFLNKNYFFINIVNSFNPFLLFSKNKSFSLKQQFLLKLGFSGITSCKTLAVAPSRIHDNPKYAPLASFFGL